jgi:hypothetical protein
MNRVAEYVSFTRWLLCNILIQFCVTTKGCAPTLSCVHSVQVFWALRSLASSEQSKLRGVSKSVRIFSWLEEWRSFVWTIAIQPEKCRASHVSVPSYGLACCGRWDRCFCCWFLGTFERSTLPKVPCVLFFSFPFSFSSLSCILHCQRCHTSLWEPSSDNFWHPCDCESRFLGSLKNNSQTAIAPEGGRWAPSSAHLCPGQRAYRARSNQWSKGSRSCPIQPATISQLAIDKHCLLVYGVSILAFRRVASNFLPTQITEFWRD